MNLKFGYFYHLCIIEQNIITNCLGLLYRNVVNCAWTMLHKSLLHYIIELYDIIHKIIIPIDCKLILL